MSLDLDVGTLDASSDPLNGAGFPRLALTMNPGTIANVVAPRGVAAIFLPSAPAPPPFQPSVVARLYAADGATLLSELDGQFDVNWQHVLNDTGNGQFSIESSDPDADKVTEGAVVKCYVAGDLVFTWLIEDADKVNIDRDEETAEVIQAKGRGWVAGVEQGLIYPAGGVGGQPVADDRVFNFATPDFVPAGWATPHDIGKQSTGPSIYHDGATAQPSNWPDGDAHWIWGNGSATAAGTNYFRAVFVLPVKAKVAICATFDDQATIYLNGVPIIADLTTAAPWRSTYRKEQTLEAGTYVIGAVVNNSSATATHTLFPAPGFGAFLCSVFTVNSAGNRDVVLLRSNVSDWLSLAYPAVNPGFTPGTLLAKVLGEMIARNVETDVTFDFTDLADSDGHPWPIIADFSAAVGSTVLAFVQALADQQWIDYAMVPGTRLLRAWNPGEHAAVTAVTYTEEVNVAELSHKQAEPITNRLLVKYQNGYTLVEDSPSIAANGVYESFFTVDVAGQLEAETLARRELARLKDGEPAIVLALEASVFLDDTPYLTFQLGDYVNAPNAALVSTSYRVLSITVEQDDMGAAVYSLELNRRSIGIDQRRVSLLQALGGTTGATAGSTVVNVTPVGGTPGGGDDSGGIGGELPGDPSTGDCSDFVDDNSVGLPVYEFVNMYVPRICPPLTVQDEVSHVSLTWGFNFAGVTIESGDHIIGSSSGEFGVGRVLDGTGLTGISDINAADFSVALMLQLASSHPAPATATQILSLGGVVNVSVADGSGGYTLTVALLAPSGNLFLSTSSVITYDAEHSIAITVGAGGAFTIYVDGTYSASFPTAQADITVYGQTFQLDLPGSAKVGRIALFDHVLTTDEVTDIAAPVITGLAILSQCLLWYDAPSYSGSGDMLNLGITGSIWDMPPNAVPFAVDRFQFRGGSPFMTSGVGDATLDVPIASGMTIGIIVGYTKSEAAGSNRGFFGKHDKGGADYGGWEVGSVPTTEDAYFIWFDADGLGTATIAQTPTGSDTVRLLAGVRPGAAANVIPYRNTIAGTDTADTMRTNFSNPHGVTIGVAGNNFDQVKEFDFLAAFVIDRALSPTELGKIASYYGIADTPLPTFPAFWDFRTYVSGDVPNLGTRGSDFDLTVHGAPSYVTDHFELNGVDDYFSCAGDPDLEPGNPGDDWVFGLILADPSNVVAGNCTYGSMLSDTDTSYWNIGSSTLANDKVTGIVNSGAGYGSISATDGPPDFGPSGTGAGDIALIYAQCTGLTFACWVNNVSSATNPDNRTTVVSSNARFCIGAFDGAGAGRNFLNCSVYGAFVAPAVLSVGDVNAICHHFGVPGF